jgi:hypothetical protein
MRYKISLTLFFGIVCCAATVNAQKQAAKDSRSALFQSALDCKAKTDAAERLACYDAAMAKMEQAEASKDLVIMEKAEISKVKKGLFGFSVPKIGLFGDDDDDKEEVAKRLETTIKSVRSLGYDKWQVTLEDGAVWAQIDTARSVTPRPGDPIILKKASMGTYFATIAGRGGIRMKRER